MYSLLACHAAERSADDSTLKPADDSTLKPADDSTLKTPYVSTLKLADDSSLKLADDSTLNPEGRLYSRASRRQMDRQLNVPNRFVHFLFAFHRFPMSPAKGGNR